MIIELTTIYDISKSRLNLTLDDSNISRIIFTLASQRFELLNHFWNVVSDHGRSGGRCTVSWNLSSLKAAEDPGWGTGLKLENYYFFTFTFSRPEVGKLLLFYVFTFSRPEVGKLLLFYVFTFSRPEVGILFRIYVFTFSRPEVGILFRIYVFTFSRPEVRKLFRIYVFTFSRPARPQ